MSREGDVNVFVGALEAMVQDVSGPIGQFLADVVETEILPLAYNTLSVPAIRPTTNTARAELREERRNNPDQVPRTHTGTLRESLRTVGPVVDEFGICAYGIAAATNEGFPYPRYLLDQGYKFLPPDDPRFIYVDVP